MPRLRLAVVGVGALGRHHARILSELPDVELVAVADSRSEQGEEIAAKCRTRWVADYRELLSRDVIDAVSVVVPTVAHRAVAGAFLEAGIPVLVEKPLAANVTHARELVRLASRQGTLLQVGHIERFNPAFQAAAPLIVEPKYSRAERTSGYTFRSTDIGVVHDLMIHDIDLVLSLVRSLLRSVEAFGTTVMGGHEDVAQARLRFENGCVADLTASRISPTAVRSLQAWSASGCVTCDMHTREVKRFAPSDALKFGPAPLDLARQPGADIEQLKKVSDNQRLRPRRPHAGVDRIRRLREPRWFASRRWRTSAAGDDRRRRRLAKSGSSRLESAQFFDLSRVCRTRSPRGVIWLRHTNPQRRRGCSQHLDNDVRKSWAFAAP